MKGNSQMKENQNFTCWLLPNLSFQLLHLFSLHLWEELKTASLSPVIAQRKDQPSDDWYVTHQLLFQQDMNGDYLQLPVETRDIRSTQF